MQAYTLTCTKEEENNGAEEKKTIHAQCCVDDDDVGLNGAPEWVNECQWKPGSLRAPGSSSVGNAATTVFFLYVFFNLKMKNLLDSKWLCQAMFLCPMGCTFVSSFQYWTSEEEAAMDKADLCRQDGGMSHRSTCARGRRCWARGAPWTGASGLLQGQYQHKKKNKMQSLEAVQGSLLMEIRFWVQEWLLSEI